MSHSFDVFTEKVEFQIVSSIDQWLFDFRMICKDVP